MRLLTKKYKVLRSVVLYTYMILTVVCACCAIYFSVIGCAEERNSTAFAAIVGALLVKWMRQGIRKEDMDKFGR